jgi:hypothetical protein
MMKNGLLPGWLYPLTGLTNELGARLSVLCGEIFSCPRLNFFARQLIASEGQSEIERGRQYVSGWNKNGNWKE